MIAKYICNRYSYTCTLFIKIVLRSQFLIALIIIISTLGIHIVDQTYGKQVKVTDTYAKLYASEQK